MAKRARKGPRDQGTAGRRRGGSVDPDEMEAMIRESFSSLRAAENPEPVPAYEIPAHERPAAELPAAPGVN